MEERKFLQVGFTDQPHRHLMIVEHAGDQGARPEVISGAAWIELDRTIQQFRAALPLPRERDARSELSEELRVVRVGGERRFADLEGLFRLVVEE
jgi:hypothetical protein